jgi:hypothetical protein
VNTLIFIGGCGLGAVVATVMIILAMRAWSKSGSKQGEAVIAQNAESARLLAERNEISRKQLQLLCIHPDPTVTEDGGRCNFCMKLHIIIEGTEDEIDDISSTISDGGGEEAMTPAIFANAGAFLKFDYSKAFPAWGYNPEIHGPEPVITVTVEREEP